MSKNRRQGHARERRILSRRQARRPPYPRILIVCEGRKTEPLYFDDIRKQNRIPSAHVSVIPSGSGTEPRQVVEFAIAEFEKSRAFEWVFPVFDRDSHRTYGAALQHARNNDRQLRNDEGVAVRFVAVPSVPCFELWILIHFMEVHHGYPRAELIRTLKQHIPGYTKSTEGIYALTEPHLDIAVRNAEQLRKRFTPDNGEDPYTGVDFLVSLLRTLRD